MTSKLPINLENLLRQRQVEGERIECKVAWKPDAIPYTNGVPSSSTGLRERRYPGSASYHTIQPQCSCAPCNARSTPDDATRESRVTAFFESNIGDVTLKSERIYSIS